jgi:putative transposase
MTTHRPILSTNEFYHVFNRSIANQPIFNDIYYLNKIIKIVNYYRFKQKIKLSKFNLLPNRIQNEYLEDIQESSSLVEIYCFTFMPNHYHFLLKQLQDKGISKFVSNIQNSFAKNFNLMNDRNGSLFQTGFKSRRIITNEDFIHISRYIHLNPVTSKIINFEKLLNYPFTSLSWYFNTNSNKFINTKYLLNYFQNFNNYVEFLRNQVEYQQKLKEIKDLLIE